MGDPRGFMTHARVEARKRPIAERIRDYREFEEVAPEEELRLQGSRCMDCGVPFCHSGCPLGNLIPDWNDFVFLGKHQEAIDRLHLTNNFPEITGRVCPAPCETSCVLGINEPAVSIKQIERFIADRAIAEGWIAPQPPTFRTGKRVAVIGSGPAGLAAAQQLNRSGHTVTVYERSDRVGGLLTYGIPDFKMEKILVERRVDQMVAEGIHFEVNAEVGAQIPVDELRREYNAILVATGSTRARELAIPGRELPGIELAMDYLPQQNRRVAGLGIPGERSIVATRKRVVVIGGGDTGSDCVGTAIRQGAESVTQIELMPRPPAARAAGNPWPEWPMILRTSSSQEEGCERDWAVSTTAFVGEGRVRALQCVKVELARDGGRTRFEPKPGSEFELKAELVLIAMGFLGPETSLLEKLCLSRDERGNVATDSRMAASIPGIFAAGDARRGQSLVVWAIYEGRRAAREIDRYLGNS